MTLPSSVSCRRAGSKTAPGAPVAPCKSAILMPLSLGAVGPVGPEGLVSAARIFSWTSRIRASRSRCSRSEMSGTKIIATTMPNPKTSVPSGTRNKGFGQRSLGSWLSARSRNGKRNPAPTRATKAPAAPISTRRRPTCRILLPMPRTLLSTPKALRGSVVHSPIPLGQQDGHPKQAAIRRQNPYLSLLGRASHGQASLHRTCRRRGAWDGAARRGPPGRPEQYADRSLDNLSFTLC